MTGLKEITEGSKYMVQSVIGCLNYPTVSAISNENKIPGFHVIIIVGFMQDRNQTKGSMTTQLSALRSQLNDASTDSSTTA